MTTKEKMLLANKDFIDSINLFGSDYKLKVVELKKDHETNDNRKMYLKHLETYLMRKNYAQDRILSERENIALTLLKDENKYRDLVQEITREYDIRSIKKYGVEKSLKYRLEFKEKSYNTVCKWILALANSRINIPKKWIANRDYNISVEIGVNEIEILSNKFNVSATELDISNCFPRILYGLNGLTLPFDFYGKDKEKKLPINIAINDFFYDKKSKTTKSVQKSNSISRFKNLGFDERVISYLITNFFESEYRGDLFNFLAFHEKKLISQVKDQFRNLDNDGIIRRHDSVIVFNNKSDVSFLNKIPYLGVNGWFNVKEIPVIVFKPVIEDAPESEPKERKLLIDDLAEFDRFYADLQKNTRFMAL